MSQAADILTTGSRERGAHRYTPERPAPKAPLRQRLGRLSLSALAVMTGMALPVVFAQPTAPEQVSNPVSITIAARSMARYMVGLYQREGTIVMPKGTTPGSTAILTWSDQTSGGDYKVTVDTGVSRLPNETYVADGNKPESVDISWKSTDQFAPYDFSFNAFRIRTFPGHPWAWSYGAGYGQEYKGGGTQQLSKDTVSAVPLRVASGALWAFNAATCGESLPMPTQLGDMPPPMQECPVGTTPPRMAASVLTV